MQQIEWNLEKHHFGISFLILQADSRVLSWTKSISLAHNASDQGRRCMELPPKAGRCCAQEFPTRSWSPAPERRVKSSFCTCWAHFMLSSTNTPGLPLKLWTLLMLLEMLQQWGEGKAVLFLMCCSQGVLAERDWVRIQIVPRWRTVKTEPSRVSGLKLHVGTWAFSASVLALA